VVGAHWSSLSSLERRAPEFSPTARGFNRMRLWHTGYLFEGIGEPSDDVHASARVESAIVGSRSRPRIVDVLRSFFSYSGRMDRGSYWTVIAIDIAVLWLVCWVFAASQGHSAAAREFASGVIIVTILAFLVSIFSACAKRLHDFDKSGGWSLVMCIGMLWLIIGVPLIGAYQGSPVRNRFGLPPAGWLRVGRD
jgi:uncharacterized membrane protein YhaH (DUF805 family)